MALVLTDFDKIWASTSPLTPYSFSDNNYKEGWNFVGATPPARQMWDYYMNLADLKSQWLYANKLNLSGGVMTGNIAGDSADFRIFNTSDTGDVAIYGGTGYTNGAFGCFYGKSRSTKAGEFEIVSTDGNSSPTLNGKPDGTFTWNGKTIIVGTEATETFENISIGANGYASATLSHSAKYVSLFVTGSNTQRVIPHMLGNTTVYLVNLNASAVTVSLTANYIY